MIRFFLILLVIFCNSGCSKINNHESSGSTPNYIYPSKDWPKKSFTASGFDSLKIIGALDYLKNACREDGIEELLLVKDGYLVYSGDSIDKVHAVWSVTKSVTSCLFGIMQAKDKIDTNDFAAITLPYLKEYYQDVQYKHFLTLTAGYDAVGGNNVKDLEKYGVGDASETPWIPSKPLFDPGTAFCYWDETMNVLGHALTEIAKEPLQDIFKREIADKIGINSDGWFWKSWSHPEKEILNGASGCCDTQLFISARELSRFGYLMLRNGKWNDKQIIPESWISTATKNHVDVRLPLFDGPRKFVDARGCYGYNWWVNGTKTDGQKLMPDTPENTYFASGFNNNMIFIIPEWNLVLVRTGIDRNPEDKIGVYNQFFKLLSEALTK